MKVSGSSCPRTFHNEKCNPVSSVQELNRLLTSGARRLVVCAFSIETKTNDDDVAAVVLLSNPIQAICVQPGACEITGPGIHVHIRSSDVTLSGFSFREATESAVFVDYGITNTQICGCRFEENTSWNGGAIRTSAFAEVYVRKSTFRSNRDQNYGGHIMSMLYTQLLVVDCDFRDGKAHQGGAIAVFFSSELMVSGSTFEANTADGTGPVIEAESFATAQDGGGNFGINNFAAGTTLCNGINDNSIELVSECKPFQTSSKNQQQADKSDIVENGSDGLIVVSRIKPPSLTPITTTKSPVQIDRPTNAPSPPPTSPPTRLFTLLPERLPTLPPPNSPPSPTVFTFPPEWFPTRPPTRPPTRYILTSQPTRPPLSLTSPPTRQRTVSPTYRPPAVSPTRHPLAVSNDVYDGETPGKDAHGIQTLYKSCGKRCGQDWVSQWADYSMTLERSGEVDPFDPRATYRGSAKGTIYTSDNSDTINFRESPRLYLTNGDYGFGDVEFTTYFKMPYSFHGRASYSGVTLVTRSNHDNYGSNPCDAASYLARINYHTGQISFEKEYYHRHSPKKVVYGNTISKTYWPHGMPLDKWIGTKFVVYTLPNKAEVKLELWVDQQTSSTTGASWDLVLEHIDADGEWFPWDSIPEPCPITEYDPIMRNGNVSFLRVDGSMIHF